MTWTPAQDALLRARIDAGDTMRQAAAALRVTRNAVAGRMMRLGITSKNISGKNITSRQPRTPRQPKPVKVTDGRKKKMFSTAYKLAEIVPPTPNKADAFKPLPGTNPKHWSERRRGECSWPVGPDGADQQSCCAPIVKGSWCAVHHRVGNVETPRMKMFNPDRKAA